MIFVLRILVPELLVAEPLVLSSITIFGAYSRQIVAVLGDSEKQAWIANTANVVTVVLAPILSYMSDSFGDRISRVSVSLTQVAAPSGLCPLVFSQKWFIIIPAAFAVVGNIIGGRASSVRMSTFAGCEPSLLMRGFVR